MDDATGDHATRPPDENAPPPLPPERSSLAQPGSNGGEQEGFGKDYGPMHGGVGGTRVIDALLKAPAGLVFELTEGRAGRVAAALLLVLVITMLGYGAIMGAFAGGAQLWAVPIKVVAGTVLSALICLPSLYIFTCLCGGRQTFREAAGLLLLAVSLTGVLLAGFAPVTWIFSQSTDTAGFMSAMHIGFWLVGTFFGLRLLDKAFSLLNHRSMSVLKVWTVIFVLVVLQMCTTLRPLVGAYAPLQLSAKKFFLTHWVETVAGR